MIRLLPGHIVLLAIICFLSPAKAAENPPPKSEVAQYYLEQADIIACLRTQVLTNSPLWKQLFGSQEIYSLLPDLIRHTEVSPERAYLEKLEPKLAELRLGINSLKSITFVAQTKQEKPNYAVLLDVDCDQPQFLAWCRSMDQVLVDIGLYEYLKEPQLRMELVQDHLLVCFGPAAETQAFAVQVGRGTVAVALDRATITAIIAQNKKQKPAAQIRGLVPFLLEAQNNAAATLWMVSLGSPAGPALDWMNFTRTNVVVTVDQNVDVKLRGDFLDESEAIEFEQAMQKGLEAMKTTNDSSVFSPKTLHDLASSTIVRRAANAVGIHLVAQGERWVAHHREVSASMNNKIAAQKAELQALEGKWEQAGQEGLIRILI